jgi:putative addiction module component (TIGR02574 family)
VSKPARRDADPPSIRVSGPVVCDEFRRALGDADLRVIAEVAEWRSPKRRLLRTLIRLASRRMSIAELHKLPADEKLKIIEALWGDLAADDAAFVSPKWHEDELRKTEADFAAGRVEAVDWEDAKKELRKRFE